MSSLEKELELLHIRRAKVEGCMKEADARHEEAVRKHKEKMSKWQSTLAGLHQRELEITRDLAKAGTAPGPTAMGVPIAQIYGHHGRPEAGGPAQHNSKYATPEDQSEEESDAYYTPPGSTQARGAGESPGSAQAQAGRQEGSAHGQAAARASSQAAYTGNGGGHDYQEDAEDDMDEEEDGYDEEEDEDDNGPAEHQHARAPPAPQARQEMAPPGFGSGAPPGFGGGAPPGFDSPKAAGVSALEADLDLPPGFSGDAAARGPPGFPRRLPAGSETREDRGIAALGDRDLRNLLVNRRRATAPARPASEAARGEAPAAQEDLRAVIEERKRLMAAGAPTPPLPPPGVAPARGGQAADNLGWEEAGGTGWAHQVGPPTHDLLPAPRPAAASSQLPYRQASPPRLRPSQQWPGEDSAGRRLPAEREARQPRAVKEWDIGKSEDPQDQLMEEPGAAHDDWQAPTHRPDAELYRGGAREREEDRWAARRDAPGAEAARSREYSAYRQQAPNGGSGQERGPSRGGWDSGGAQAGGYGREPIQAPAGRNGVPRLPLDDEFPGLNMGQQRVPKDEEFPPLGSGPAVQPRGAWGSSNTAQLLAKMTTEKEAEQGGLNRVKSGADPTQLEITSGLRVPGDDSPDAERRKQMRSKRDFVHEERIAKGGRERVANVVEGLELHRGVLNAAEQAMMVSHIESWMQAGRLNKLKGRTFSAPRKSMKGKGRITIQFGCCYNYAVDQQGRRPGIIPEEVVEPMPDVLVALVLRLCRWGVLPAASQPDSAIINIYEEEDCIPPHIDHHDFSRPFCTLSLLSEQSIMFGSRLYPKGPGEFAGSDCFIPLPPGSCLVLKGNGADLAMHCVPPVSHRRMSITLRRMGDVHAQRVKQQVERIQSGLKTSPRWADDEVEDPPPRRYGADDGWSEDEEEERGGKQRPRRQVISSNSSARRW